MSKAAAMKIALNNNEVDKVTRNIAEKMQIARNVVRHCERMQKSHNRHYSSAVEKITGYTGVSKDTIEIADDTVKIAKTFIEWYREKESEETANNCVLFDSVREEVLELYTQKNQVVTKERLVKGLFDKKHLKMRYEQFRLTKDILRHGFIWKRLPGTKKTIIMERSAQSLKRMEYLRKLRAYREAGRMIVYVDVCCYYYQLVVSPQFGLLHVGCQLITTEIFQRVKIWTTDTLTKVLPPNSVVVIKEAPLHEQKAPSPYSSKNDMISWLAERKMDYDPGLHKADLYALIKKVKGANNFHQMLEGILKDEGHDVLCRPQELASLNYLEIMWPELTSHTYRLESLHKMKEITLEEWQRFEKLLISREENTYKEEKLIETVLDKLLTRAKYGELTAADLAECDDEFPDDEYYERIIIP